MIANENSHLLIFQYLSILNLTLQQFSDKNIVFALSCGMFSLNLSYQSTPTLAASLDLSAHHFHVFSE